MLLIAVEATAPVSDAFARKAWGSFSRQPILTHSSETVEIAVDGATGTQREYKLRLTRRSSKGPDKIVWANSRTCPAVAVTLRGLQNLKTPPIVPIGFDPQPTEMIVDGTSYSLTAPLSDSAGQSNITWTSNVGTPLAAWVDGSLARLRKCWSITELRVTRKKDVK